MGVDRTQAIMPRMPAALLEPRPSRRQIKLIVKHHDIGNRQLIEIQSGPNRFTRQVHKGARLQKQHLFPTQTPLGNLTFER